MAAVLDYAERRSRDAIAALADGDVRGDGRLEAADGTAVPLRVSVTIEGETMQRRLRGLGRAGGRQPELPAAGDPGGDPVRDPRA